MSADLIYTYRLAGDVRIIVAAPSAGCARERVNEFLAPHSYVYDWDSVRVRHLDD